MSEPKVLPADVLLDGLSGTMSILRDRLSMHRLHVDGYTSEAKQLRVGGNRRKAEDFTAKAKAAQEDADTVSGFIAALEQAVSIIEALTHPGFYGISTESAATVEAVTPERGVNWIHGKTVPEALLKAHEVLYPSTPKTEGGNTVAV